MSSQPWLVEYSTSAARTDKFKGKAEQRALLATGIVGEAGSILTELKKKERDRDSYPEYRRRMLEEFGDFLWYFVRLTDICAPELLRSLSTSRVHEGPLSDPPLSESLRFGGTVGALAAAVADPVATSEPLPELLERAWGQVTELADAASVSLEDAASRNLAKIRSRWPTEKVYRPLLDESDSEEEQLPRKLQVEFRERSIGDKQSVVLRCNGLNFGDRLTDNIEDPDFYRYHDIFHFAHAVYLGWSPVTRALLRCKRKSRPSVDEAQDGARAGIIEEAITAVVYSRAKGLASFDGIESLDYDLLKTIADYVRGYEVEQVPLWQWERAILEGYRVFRLLRSNKGGVVSLDLKARRLSYVAPEK